MKKESEENLERRRRHAAWLRYCADRSEATAAEMRKQADELDPDQPGIVKEP